jgi:hypothetical protein
MLLTQRKGYWIELDNSKAEGFRCVQKLKEPWDGESELIEKLNFELAGDSSADPSKKAIKVSADTSE